MNPVQALPLILLLCFVTHSTYGQESDAQKVDLLLRKYLQSIHEKKSFHGEVLIAKEQKIIFNDAIGSSSFEKNLATTTGSPYRIASISKTFTAALIAIAQEEHKLAFDDQARLYIKNLSEKFSKITIHQLLTHTSGLPHNEGIKDYWLIKSRQPLTNDQILAEINGCDLLFEPGLKMHYSSLGYYLLSAVLENVYQDSYHKILHHKILTPLQLNQTDGGNTLPTNSPTGYHAVKDDSLVIAPHRRYDMLKGAGDMFSTTRDLINWTTSFFDEKLVSEKTLQTMLNGIDLTPPTSKSNYCYGWYVKTDKPKRYHHGGGTWGYSSWLAYYPDEKLTIVVLSNVSVLPVESIGTDLERIMYGLPFEFPKMETVVASDSTDAGIYAGHYISDSGKMNVTISVHSKNDLYLQLAGNPPFQIYPKGNYRYFGKKVEIELAFEVKDHVVTGFKAERMGQTFHFTKL
jgi:CubicO group peptidase (beta-lactamase class C family)